jgi:predicted transposase/invertase (TIGR01784 family)
MPECGTAVIEDSKTEYTPKTQSRLDTLTWIDDGEKKFILQIEPQGYYDKALPARMLRYCSDVWEYTINKGWDIPRIKQVVVFFYPEHDNKRHRLENTLNNEIYMNYHYDVIQVWKQKKQIVIENKLVGLYPLLPLMEQNQNVIPEEIIEQAINVINKIDDVGLRIDLLSIMAILSEEIYPSELIKRFIGRELIMKSTLLREWVTEAQVDARAEEKIEIAKKMLKRGVRLEYVAEDTDLPLSTIQELAQSIQLQQ